MRSDLYFRLNVIQITIPPLRERIDDIRPLARFFIEHYNRKFKRSIEGLSDLATNLLLSYDWPGNVRELRNAIERGMILEESALITSSSLPTAISRPDGHVSPPNARKHGNPPNGRRSRIASAVWWPGRWSGPAATRLRRRSCCESVVFAQTDIAERIFLVCETG